EDIPFYFMAMLQATRITLVREFLYRYSVYREGSTTHAVMSTYPRLIHILQETRKQIAPWLEDQVVSQQFSRFQVTQLLSFLIYAFHRQDVRRFTRLRFFCMISRELQALDQRDLKLLSLTDKMLSGLIRRRQLRLYHVKKAADVVR